MKLCTLCGEDREEVSVYPVAPATWNGFCNFAQVCAECAALPKNRTRLKAPAAPKATAATAAEPPPAGHISIAHRRTGAVLLSLEARTFARAIMRDAALSQA